MESILRPWNVKAGGSVQFNQVGINGIYGINSGLMGLKAWIHELSLSNLVSFSGVKHLETHVECTQGSPKQYPEVFLGF